LKVWNENNSPKLQYGNAGGKTNGLQFVGEVRILIACTKSQAIDIISFLNAIKYKREEEN